MKRVGWAILLSLVLSLHAELGSAREPSKYDHEVEEALEFSVPDQSKHVKTSDARALRLFQEGTYLADVELGHRDRKGRLEEGIRRLKRALELDPSFAAAHLALGDVYYQRSIVGSKYDRITKEERKAFRGYARDEYTTAVQLDPNSPAAHYKAARTALDGKDRVHHLKKALELDPDLEIGSIGMAHIAETEGRVQEAFDNLIERMRTVHTDTRCLRVKHVRPSDYGLGYFHQKYPKEYAAFVERVCTDRDMPPYRPGGGL